MANTKQNLIVDTQKHQCIGSQNTKEETKEGTKRTYERGQNTVTWQ